ncbi:replication-relaxation family protein [Streptacidiphilus sp. PAMC 29251]
MKNNDTASLLEMLSERDLAILDSLRTHRVLLTTILIRRLHFPIAGERQEAPHDKTHASEMAAAVATIRVLSRLELRRFIARLPRRIGGVRAGSSGITWQLGFSGERVLRARYGDSARRRYSPPSTAFIAHTLAAADLAICLYELDRRGALELLTLEAEPECWRTFLSAHGARQWLKPDLFAITAGPSLTVSTETSGSSGLVWMGETGDSRHGFQYHHLTHSPRARPGPAAEAAHVHGGIQAADRR